MYADEAAVELLIGHRSWLCRSDFVDRFVKVEADAVLVGPRPMAVVDWQAAVTALEAGQLACSGKEGRMLRLAVSIAAGVPVDLRDALGGLDATNLALAATAVLHAGGRYDAAVGVDDRPFPPGRR